MKGCGGDFKLRLVEEASLIKKWNLSKDPGHETGSRVAVRGEKILGRARINRSLTAIPQNFVDSTVTRLIVFYFIINRKLIVPI